MKRVSLIVASLMFLGTATLAAAEPIRMTWRFAPNYMQ
jgi:hypothetical protein